MDTAIATHAPASASCSTNDNTYGQDHDYNQDHDHDYGQTGNNTQEYTMLLFPFATLGQSPSPPKPQSRRGRKTSKTKPALESASKTASKPSHAKSSANPTSSSSNSPSSHTPSPHSPIAHPHSSRTRRSPNGRAAELAGRLNFAQANDRLTPQLTPRQLRDAIHLYREELEREIEDSLSHALHNAVSDAHYKTLRRQRGKDRAYALISNMPTPNRIIWRRVLVRLVGFHSRSIDKGGNAIWNRPWDEGVHRSRAYGVCAKDAELDFGMRPVPVLIESGERESWE